MFKTLKDAICVSFWADGLGKDMNLSLLPPATSKWLGRLGSIDLVWQPVLEKENSKFKPVLSRLKIILSHILFLTDIRVNTYILGQVLYKTEYMCFNQTGDISTLEGTSLKLVDKFTCQGSSVSSTEKDMDTQLTKAWRAIDRLSIRWKSDLTHKMKRSFFLAAVVSILLYGCTTWTLTKRLEKMLDGNYTRMLRAMLNKSLRQHPTRHQLYSHVPPITKTIQVRRTRHAGHCWRSRDELISDILQWTPTYDRAKAGRPARTYIQQAMWGYKM